MGLILLVTCFIFMDQILLAPSLSNAARDFEISHVERDNKLGGEISLSLWLVGAPPTVCLHACCPFLESHPLYSRCFRARASSRTARGCAQLCCARQ
jgi:hypothetical protein